LEAFAHGRLPEEEWRVLETHVSACETCCEVLRRIPHDDLIANLRSSLSHLPGKESSGSAALDPIRSSLASHPRYQLVRELGSGGMGVVYLAEHRVMGRQVALKVINSRLLRNQVAVERFRQEVQAAARLNHRNIVTAYDAEQAGDLHFLVMEFVEGTDLATTVARRGPLPVLQACNAILQAANGLQHAHEQGMVHRDIKPQNLMRTRKGVIKILDFGLARLASPSESEAAPAGLTREGVTLGTPDYIAPEQARDARRADIRSDIYSLGCTLYALLTGTVPFPTGTVVEKVLAHCTTAPTPVPQLRAGLPPALVAIVERMMAKDPADRFQTPAEVAAALKPFGQPSGQPTSESLLPETPVLASSVTRADHDAEPDFDFVLKEPLSALPRQSPPAGLGRWLVPGLAGAIVLVGGIAFLNSAGQRSPDLPGESGKTLPESSAIPTVSRGDTQGWQDLLVSLDPQARAVAGAWQVDTLGLRVTPSEWARIVLTEATPREYDLEVEFTRLSGEHSIAVIFAAGQGQGTFEIDAWATHRAGFQSIRGQDLRQQPDAGSFAIENGKRYQLRLEVRTTRVTGYVDGQQIAQYRGDGSELSCLDSWRLPRQEQLGLGAFDAETVFHSVRLRAFESAP